MLKCAMMLKLQQWKMLNVLLTSLRSFNRVYKNQQVKSKSVEIPTTVLYFTVFKFITDCQNFLKALQRIFNFA